MYPDFGVIILAKWNEVTHYHRKPQVGPVQSEIIRALKFKQPKKITERFKGRIPRSFCDFMFLLTFLYATVTILFHPVYVFAKLLKQGYRYHKLRKAFYKFYRRNYELFQNSVSDLNLFNNKAYRNQNFMVS